jgi:hypothetical protein
MLTMEPPMSRLTGYNFKSKLTKEDIFEMRLQIRDNFDKIQIILKQIPSNFLLILRLYIIYKCHYNSHLLFY